MQLSLAISCCCHCSVGKSHPTLFDSVDCSTPGFPVLHYLLEFAQTHIHWVGDAIHHLILCHPLLLLPLSFPAFRVFSESVLGVMWPKYWSFSFSISPSNEHPGLISIRMDWLDLLAVQGTLKSLLQWVYSMHQIAKVLESKLQQQSFWWTFRVDFP